MGSNTRTKGPELKIDFAAAKARISAVLTTAKVAVERLGLRDRARADGTSYKLQCPGRAHLHGDRNPSLLVFDGDGVVVHCPVCSWTGGVVDLAGIARCDGRPHEIEWGAALAAAALAAGVDLGDCAAKRGRPRKQLPDEVRGELLEIRNRLVPLVEVPAFRTTPRWHAEVRSWVESRALDAARLDAARYHDGHPIAGCLGADVAERTGSRTLGVLCRRDGSWDNTGHRFLVPLWDHRGWLAAFAGRATNGHQDKSYLSTGAVKKGVVFANALGRLALLGRDELTEAWDRLRASRPELPAYPRVYVAEGEVDYLTVALHPETADAIVLGVVGESWSVEVAGCVPTGSEVYLLVDADKPGCDYRDAIARSLLGRKIHAYHLGAPEDRPDQNDLHRADRSAYSPSGVCQPYEVPAPVQAAERDAASEKRSAAQKLLDLATEAEPTLIRDWDTSAPYLGVKDGPVETAVPADGVATVAWLRGLWDFEYPTVPLRGSDVKTVAETLSARAARLKRRERVYRRVGGCAGPHGTVFIDLCDGTGDAIEVDRLGWRIASPRVHFARPDAQLPLPRPQRVPDEDKRTTFERFFRLVRVPEVRRPQVVAWLLACCLPDGPYPIVVFGGGEGTAKSSSSKKLCDVVDPSRNRERTAPKNEETLIVAAQHAHVLDYDNLSTLSGELSDLLCKFCTGGTDAKRRLWTVGDEVAVSIKRPVVVNGIPDLATRPDLLDRAIVLQLDPIEKVIPDEEIKVEWEDLRPKILGILCDGISSYLRHGPAKLESYPRLADFYALGEAAIEACGYPRGSVVGAYDATRKSQVLATLDASTTYSALARILSRGTWTGRLSDLLDRMRDPAHTHPADLRHLPAGAIGLEAWLRRHGKSMALVGVKVERLTRDETGVPYRILRETGAAAPALPARPQPQDTAPASSGRRSEVVASSTEDIDRLLEGCSAPKPPALN